MQEKLIELAKIAQEENKAVASVLHTIIGSLATGTEKELADHVFLFTVEQLEEIANNQ